MRPVVVRELTGSTPVRHPTSSGSVMRTVGTHVRPPRRAIDRRRSRSSCARGRSEPRTDPGLRTIGVDCLASHATNVACGVLYPHGMDTPTTPPRNSSPKEPEGHKAAGPSGAGPSPAARPCTWDEAVAALGRRVEQVDSETGERCIVESAPVQLKDGTIGEAFIFIGGAGRARPKSKPEGPQTKDTQQ